MAIVEETEEERPLTRAQEARRQRVVDAAMELAHEGGYEAVQMRDVATKADVAMGTVYRYFTSKDHLLAASLVFWVRRLEQQLALDPAKGSSAGERVLEVLDRALSAMGDEPKLSAALFLSLSSPDPTAVQCQLEVTGLMDDIITTAIGEPAPSKAAGRSRIIGHVWYSATMGWIHGWSTIGRVYDELALAVELLLPEPSAR